MLLGAKDYRFYPINEESEPTGQALTVGSIGASLLNNLNATIKENRFTELLIQKAKIRAEAGLKFYEAMLEEHKEAIRRI